ncbi:uracil-DNA glycosylase [Microbacterium aurum]
MSVAVQVADYSRLPASWADALPRTLDVDSLYASVDALYSARPGAVSPLRRTDVFRAFHLTPLASVRVVILGEDPYPDPAHAHGLAFSMPSVGRVGRPQSLGKIFGSLRRDLNLSPQSNDLSPWAARGVLLLNVALTHRMGAKTPDASMWEDFTRAVLELVAAKSDRVAWLLWGEFAVDLADSVQVSSRRHRRFENAHPRASRANRPLLGQDPPFTKASMFLGTNPLRDWSN